jgi:hypothetical protein
MACRTSRRGFLTSVLAATAALTTRNEMSASKNKRDAMLSILDKKARQDYIPAAFFIHFDTAFHFGQPAVEKHLEYFRYTGMDFVKIQYERTFPPIPDIKRPEDWRKMPSYGLDFYQPVLEAVQGLVRAAKSEALILMTLYSPFMCAGHTTSLPLVTAHLQEDPEPVRKGLEAITSSLKLFVRECVRLGVDGFYASTQGGEAGRFRDPRLFTDHVKPFDLVLMNETKRSCRWHPPRVRLPRRIPSFSHRDAQPIVSCSPKLARETGWTELRRCSATRHGGGPASSRRAAPGHRQGGSRRRWPKLHTIRPRCGLLPGDIKWRASARRFGRSRLQTGFRPEPTLLTQSPLGKATASPGGSLGPTVTAQPQQVSSGTRAMSFQGPAAPAESACASPAAGPATAGSSRARRAHFPF